MSPASFLATTIDCDDASRSAAFYAGLLGWEVTYEGDGMASVEGDGHTLYFGEVEGYEPAGWPSPVKQFHLDLRAPDPAAMQDQVEELGGSLPDFQPGEGRWLVYLDPAGHPFCISATS